MQETVMNNINRFLLSFLLAVACGFFVACSSDDEVTSVEVNFSVLEGVDTSLLNSCDYVVGSFELTSDGSWHLYSDKMWVTLSVEPDGDFMNDIRGGAGNYKVYVKVSNDARGFEVSKADITLLAGGLSQNVATVIRPAGEYVFELFNEEGSTIESIEMECNASVWVKPATNFDCSVLSVPEWLAEPEFSDGGYMLTVVGSAIPMVQQGTVVFGNRDGSQVYNVPVNYAGMDPYEMIIEGDYTPWGWVATLDGKTYVQENTSIDGNVTTTVENGIDYTITCFNYDFNFVYTEQNSGRLTVMDAEESWIKTLRDNDNPSAVRVSVEPSSNNSRSGYLFAVPAALYSSFMDSLKLSTNVDDFVDSNLSMVVAQLTQKADTDGFTITDSNDAAVQCTAESEYYEWLSSEFSITDITTCNLVPGESYTINTKLTESDWKKNLVLEDLEGNDQRTSYWKLKTNVGNDGFYRITITVPATLSKTIILRLYTPQIVNIKALVIRPVANDK